MKTDLLNWKHVFKLDPDRYLDDDDLEQICRSGTDAIIVGGSSGITYDNTADLLSRIRRFEVACTLEISDRDAIVPGFDLYFIPVVLNTEDGAWITGQHHKAIRENSSILDFDLVVPEGYVILNKQSTAALVTGAHIPETQEDLTAYALMADRLFHMPVFYIEYSGIFGDMTWVRAARATLRGARLFYGGGIRTPEQAVCALDAADTIVVGNIIYENISLALATVPGRLKHKSEENNHESSHSYL
ncbi:MAG: heptaprenylglyceryl phosphate synthase [Gorillibacterium sp.]|nr:heptaprenylglyceryl phosphate synthase [Gorillibacterium sp.]